MRNFEFRSESRLTPIVKNLLIINGLVFLAQITMTQYNLDELGSLHYYKSDLFRPFQFATSMFMHGGIGHIIFNMLTLFMFGPILERVWGPKRFLIFYLVCGLCASLLTQFTIPYSVDQMLNSGEFAEELALYPREVFKNALLSQYSALGASGAIMGVMAAFAYLFPNTQLFIMLIPIPVKAKYAIPFLVLIDLFGGVYRIKGDNIGHFAHLGGAIAGFLFVLYWNRTNRRTLY